KLDRSKLPRAAAPSSDPGRSVVEPRNEVERILRDVFRSTLGLATGPSTTEDFFLDLGGDSLRAAEAVSKLRTHPSTEHLTVRAVYAGRTIAGIAAIEPARQGAPTARALRLPVSGLRILLSNTIQLTVLAASVFVTAASAWFVGARVVPAVTAQ